MLETHSSKPFNPDIARVFYRAGYIESWGRGIQKICDACKNLGADGPVYIVYGEDIMVKFNALQNAKVPNSKVSKHQSTADFGALDDALVQKILEVLRHKPNISQGEMAEELGTTRRVIQKKMILLKEAGRIERIGGKRYGRWEIHELVGSRRWNFGHIPSERSFEAIGKTVSLHIISGSKVFDLFPHTGGLEKMAFSRAKKPLTNSCERTRQSAAALTSIWSNRVMWSA